MEAPVLRADGTLSGTRKVGRDEGTQLLTPGIWLWIHAGAPVRVEAGRASRASSSVLPPTFQPEQGLRTAAWAKGAARDTLYAEGQQLLTPEAVTIGIEVKLIWPDHVDRPVYSGPLPSPPAQS